MKLKLYACLALSVVFILLCPKAFSQNCSPSTLVGGTTYAPATVICQGTFCNMSVTSGSAGTGLSYQWEASTDSITWMAITGAASSTYSTTQLNLYYRRKTICSSGGIAYSTALRVNAQNFLTCYCTPNTSCSISYRIINVSCATINNSSPCGTNGYSNYGGIVAAPDMMQGSYVPVSVTVGTSNSGRTVDCYVDVNHSGSFETNELATLTSPSGNIYSGFIKLPYHALTGTTMMRIIYSSTGYSSVCTPGNSSETEDYYINITPNTTGVTGYVLYVKQTAAGSDNSGSSWANAFTNLAKALQVAATGDTIKVAKGTYYTDTGYSNGFVLRDAITILGGYPATGNPTDADRNVSANTTILSGYRSATLTSNPNYHVLYASGAMPACLVDGFVLENGGNTSSSNVGPLTKGGGLYAENGANPTLKNCIIRNNYPNISGTAIAVNQSSPVFYNCIITNNTNANINLGPAYTSVVLAEKNSSPVFYNLLMTGNKANTLLHADSSTVTVKNSTIAKNSLVYNIINAANISSLNLQNSILYYNTTNNNNYQSVIFDTADIKLSSSTASLINCITQLYQQGTNVLAGYQPKFRDTSSVTGPDGLFFTTDDGFALNNPCSPAINAGSNVLATGLSTDITGNPRTFEGTVDVGAYEVQQSKTVIPSTVYVRANATGLNNGTSWANAFTDLHKALQSCSDTVKIATGTYAPFLTGN